MMSWLSTTLGNEISRPSPQPVVPNLFGTSDWLLAHLLLTSCCVARFLTGQGPLLVRGLGVGDPCPRRLMYLTLNFGDSSPRLEGILTSTHQCLLERRDGSHREMLVPLVVH